MQPTEQNPSAQGYAPFTPNSAPQKKSSKTVIITVVSLIAFAAAFIGVNKLISHGAASLYSETKQSTDPIPANMDNQTFIKQAVDYVKETTKLPKELDEMTTWVAVSEQPNAILYEYQLRGIDASKLNNDNVKGFLVPTLCSNKSSRAILNKGVTLNYIYTIKDSTQKFSVSVSKADCTE